MLNGAYHAARAAFFALAALAATSLIDVVLTGPVPVRGPWTVQALVEERPLIPDGLALRGLRLRLQTVARNIAHAMILTVVRFAQFFLGEFA